MHSIDDALRIACFVRLRLLASDISLTLTTPYETASSFFRALLVFFYVMTVVCPTSQAAESLVFRGSGTVDPLKPSEVSLNNDLRKKEFTYYLEHPPFKKDQKYRLILALHGAGERAENYIKIWHSTALKNKTVVAAPQLDAKLFLFNARQDPSIFFEFIEFLKQNYPIDEDRIFVAGASMGAATGTFLIQKRPEYWRGAVLVASIGFLTCFPGTSASQVRNFTEFPPILYVMGDQDTVNLGPVIEGRDFLLKQGAKSQLYRYKTAGHEHRPEWNKRIFKWIENVETDKSPAE